MTKVKEIEREEAAMRLRKMLRPGTEVNTILRRVSASGMTRHISLVVVHKGQIIDITYWAGRVLGLRRDSTTGGLVVGGCGMDMGFYVVYSLSRRLYPKGFKLPKGKRGRNGDESGFDDDGGYALEHRWL